MNTNQKRKATQIRFEGPDADVDRVSGDEIPQWYVYAADADREPAGKEAQDYLAANKRVIDQALATLDAKVHLPEARAFIDQFKALRADYVQSYTRVRECQKPGA